MKFIILAGGKAPEDLQKNGIQWRHQLVFEDRTFLEIAIDAVKDHGEIVVVGQDAPAGIETQAPGKNFLGSFQKGLESCTGESQVAVLSADLPFITSRAVKEFLDKCDPGAGLNYSIANVAQVDAAYPGMKRTTIRVAEGEFTAGNLAILDREIAMKQLPLIQNLYDSRKSPLKLGKILGFGPFFAVLKSKVAPQTIRIEEFEQKLSKVLGLKVRGIITEDPCLAADVDNSSHYAWLIALEKARK